MTGAYVHGYGPREHRRLQDQASTLVELLHSDTTYPEGSRVLEAGCGVGAQTVALATQSPKALMTSIDVSHASVVAARKAVRAAGIHNVTLLQADLFQLPFPPESFDHVFVCFVLEHLAQPVAALRALKGVLKPGGTMTVIEGDHGSTYFYPDSDYARRVVRCQVELQARAKGNALLGRALYPLLTEAGFGEVHVSPRMVYVDASKPALVEGFIKNTFTAMIEGIRPSALEAGLTSEADFDRGVADLYRTAEADGVFCYTFFKASAVNGSPAEPGAPGDAPRAARPSVPVPTPGGRRAEGEPTGQGVVARRGLRRANDAIRAVPAASSFAVADDFAIVVGGPQRPGPQQEGEEGERASGGGGEHRGLLQSEEIVEGSTRGGCPHFLWITSARPGTVVKRDAELRWLTGLRGKWPAGKGIG